MSWIAPICLSNIPQSLTWLLRSDTCFVSFELEAVSFSISIRFSSGTCAYFYSSRCRFFYSCWARDSYSCRSLILNWMDDSDPFNTTVLFPDSVISIYFSLTMFVLEASSISESEICVLVRVLSRLHLSSWFWILAREEEEGSAYISSALIS